MEKEEEEALLVKVAADYEDALGLVGKPVDGTEIAMQLPGLVSFSDFEDKKKLRVCTGMIRAVSRGVSKKKYKRLTLYKFLCILCLECIYYETDLRETSLYSVVS
jgi:hypothetical protein